MNKSDVVAAIAASTGSSKAVAETHLNALRTVMQEAISSGKNMSLSGMLKLSVARKPAGPARNPHTGEMFDAPARNVARIKISGALKTLAGLV